MILFLLAITEIKYGNVWCKVKIYPSLSYKRKCYGQAGRFEDKEKS